MLVSRRFWTWYEVSDIAFRNTPVLDYFFPGICILCVHRLTSFCGSCSDWEQPRAQLFFCVIKYRAVIQRVVACHAEKYESWTPAWSLCWRVPIKWKFNIIKGQYDIKTEKYSILDWLVRTASWWFGLKSLSCFALEWFQAEPSFSFSVKSISYHVCFRYTIVDRDIAMFAISLTHPILIL